ncbi:MAG TPA: aldehyde dehydrogenase family protein [Solirubrobacterales bacterium]|jgi:aldehyde dehydrogenase|nr:aldehyde dehydrogenase family protein [Solirubrobacterales bacterium]
MATMEKQKAFQAPGEAGSPVELRDRYDNFIGGGWVAPTEGRYRENLTPATGQPFSTVADSTPADVELALDAAHDARVAWGATSPTERAAVLNAMADAVEENLQMLAIAESWENGKPVRETLAADIPLVVDHLRYFAGAVRSEEGRISEVDAQTYAYHFHEPLGVVGQIIPFNFPLLMAAWKIAPALAAGNCTVIKPASPTPWSILKLAEVVGDVVPPGVLNVVNGPGAEIGRALASSKRIAKVAFTGETVTGRLIMQYAAQNIIPSTTELGGKSPNVFFEDVMAADDDFLDKAIEGFVLYAFNKGEVCTAPSRALIHESIYDVFMERVLERVRAIKQGNPLDPETMMGPQVSAAQLEKIEGYVKIGIDEGAEVLTGGHRPDVGEDLAGGYYFEPTVLKGTNDMRVFQEEIFGPVVSVTTFKDEAEALSIANDTLYGLGAGVWTRDGSRAFRMGRGIEAGRVWTNCYHQYPAHAAFGGYKISGVGRENHRMMLDHYSQTKCMLVSYDPKPMGFF